MFGRTLIATNTIQPTRVSADGNPSYKPGGLGIDWTSVSALGSDTTYPDGSTVKSGQKVLRYGQVLCKITGGTNTLTFGGTPTGGTFPITVTTSSPVAGAASQTTTQIAYNASAATVQAALVALTNVGAGNVTVTGSAGGPYTFVFAPILGTVVISSSVASLTGGTPTVAVGASVGAANTTGLYGPYDPSASDGRQTLTKGECYILDETVLQYTGGSAQVGGVNDQIGGVFDAGLVWIERVLQSGTATHTLALGPTKAEVLAAIGVRIFEN